MKSTKSKSNVEVAESTTETDNDVKELFREYILNELENKIDANALEVNKKENEISQQLDDITKRITHLKSANEENINEANEITQNEANKIHDAIDKSIGSLENLLYQLAEGFEELKKINDTTALRNQLNAISIQSEEVAKKLNGTDKKYTFLCIVSISILLLAIASFVLLLLHFVFAVL